MQASNIPNKFPIPFANAAGGGYIRPIPTASQISITQGAASLTDGFPPLNSIPVASGGIPPFMQDFNGLLKQLSQWSQWYSAGGPVQYDSVFSAAIGGYPQGTVISAAALGQFWLSITDNNTTDPDTGGSGWIPLNRGPGTLLPFSASTTWTVPPGIFSLEIMMVGGGGGGAGCTASQAGGAGGAGGFAWGTFAVTPGEVLTILIGSAGSSGSTTINSSGGTGGTTSVTGLAAGTVQATGGIGGMLSVAAPSGGSPGIGSGGSINQSGGWGTDGDPSGVTFGGDGGGSFFGGGGRAAKNLPGTPGGASGSGGGSSYSNTTASIGGAGAPGFVIFRY